MLTGKMSLSKNLLLYNVIILNLIILNLYHSKRGCLLDVEQLTKRNIRGSPNLTLQGFNNVN